MSGIHLRKSILLVCSFSLISYATQLFSAAGDLVFKYQTEGPIFSSPAIGMDGTIYVGSDDYNLYAVNPDGSPRWKFITNGPVKSSPAIIGDGTIYFGSEDSSLYSVNPDGTENWIYKTMGPIGPITASPAIGGNGIIYLGSGNLFNSYMHKKGPITDPRRELLASTYSTESIIEFSSVAVVSDLMVYVGVGDQLHAFFARISLAWKRLEGSPVQSSPAVDEEGNIYIGSFDNNLYAFTPNSEQKWSFQTNGPIFSSPAIGPNLTVYVGSQDHNLYAVTSEGSLIWQFTTDGPVNSSPAVGSDGTIYVGSEDHNLYAITPEGALKWKYTTGGPVNSSPAIGFDGTVYVGSDDGFLYAVESGTEAGLADSPWPKFRHDSQNTGLIQLPAIGNFAYEIFWPGTRSPLITTYYNFGLPPGEVEWYWTQGNNLEVVLHTSGQHRVWAEQKSVIWPRGSGEKMMAYEGLWYGGVGHFSLDEKMDTTIQRHNDSGHDPGLMPTNFWWREDGLYYQAQQDLDGDGGMDLPQGSLKLKVSTREGDLDGLAAGIQDRCGRRRQGRYRRRADRDQR